jgi:S-DNA-T family DNA segregation ATPase FtsK/SpoIIIE
VEIVVALRVVPGTDCPVTIQCSPDTTADNLCSAIARFLGLVEPTPVMVERSFRALTGAITVSQLALRDGDRLLLGDAAAVATREQGIADTAEMPSAAPTSAPARWDLLVVGGPCAGQRHPLLPGTTVVGRQGTDVVIADPSVSRRHLEMTLAGHSLQVVDLSSSNGTFLEGHRLVEQPTHLSAGQVLEIGDTFITVEEAQRQAPTRSIPLVEGHVLFNRSPRIRQPPGDWTLTLSEAPSPPAKRRLPLVASLLPVLLGLVMYAVLHQVMFLLFTAMGPIMAVGSLIEDRRGGQHTFRAAQEKFDQELQEATDTVTKLRQQVVARRRDEAPSPAHLLERAHGTSPTLWERSPADEDFLTLRLGLADLPGQIRVLGGEGGDSPTAARVERLRSLASIDVDVPVTVNLQDCEVVGLAGPPAVTESSARWLMLQTSLLASPRDLILAAVVNAQELSKWQWLPWLPHARSGDMAGGPWVAAGEHAGEVTEALIDLVKTRQLERGNNPGGRAHIRKPDVLLLIGRNSGMPPATLSQLLRTGPEVGVRVIVLADSSSDLPVECQAVTTTSPSGGLTLTFPRTGAQVTDIIPDALAAPTAHDVARALAPVRDVTARQSGGDLPRSLRLLELMNLDEPTAADIVARWEHPAGGLEAVVGVTTAGPLALDLRADGPHSLVAGTSGAGKSELLQSLVASLAAAHPPARLTFFLIDYKGGAAFKDCVLLPHTVGFVTNLDTHLAARALVSLEAELRHRESLLKSVGAKDLTEMTTRAPATAPPSLLIVVDEFAFLKKELPDFVAGIVNIAQRGRSLGVHLVLATQRPSGVIDDQIRSNTGLRIALRVTDSSDSSDVIDRPDAARIPGNIPGRAFVRTARQDVREIQTAYVGGVHGQSRSELPVLVRPFGLDVPQTVAAPSTDEKVVGSSDLQVLVGAISAAAEQLQLPAPRAPWLAPLSGRYDLDAIASDAPAERLIATLGVLDDPHNQEQRPWQVHLDEVGSLLVYGTSGSGKTTLLRTLAVALAQQQAADYLHIYGLDFASHGLRCLEALPQCGGVVLGGETERAERLFTMLEAVIDKRRILLGEVGATSVGQLRIGTADPLPDVVVLLDGYSGFVSTFGDIDYGELVNRLGRCVAEGRGAGVHFVISADRSNAVPMTLTASIPARVVLRMADENEYAYLGMAAAARGATLAPGRGFTNSGFEVQVAVVAGDGDGQEQARAVTTAAHRMSAPSELVPKVEMLPTEVALDSLPRARDLTVPLGLEGARMSPAVVDLAEGPMFLVTGPDHSGRSTALITAVHGVQQGVPGVESYLLAPRKSPLVGCFEWTARARGLDECEQLATQLAASARDRNVDTPYLVVVDDGDLLLEGKAAYSLERLIKLGRDSGLILLAASTSHVVHRTFGTWLTDVRKCKHGLLLRPDVEIDGEIFGVKLPRRSRQFFPSGRGYLVRRSSAALIQVARSPST